MTLTTINLTGNVLPPDSIAVGGTVTFELSSVVIDADSGIVVPRIVSTPILASGFIDVDIWPNARGSFPTYYTVSLYTPAEYPGGDPRRIILGTIQLPSSPSTQNIATYLASYAATVPPAAFWSSITQNEYDTVIAAAAQAVAFGSIYTQTDAQLLSVTIPADVDVVQRMPSVTGQVAPQNIVSRWRRNASPGAEAFWTDATGANFTVAEITQAEILSTLTSALDAAFTDPAFSGQARIANGTQSAPSLAFASDLDTGIYYQNTNSIGFTAGGTRRAFLSSTAMQVDVPITGTAVTSSNDDDTPGRLMKTGDGGILGSGILLTGATDLKDRALEGGLYGYLANVVTGGPETAAWAHALFANHNDTANRRGFLDIRLTSGTNIRAWIGSNASDTGVIDWFEILTTNAIPPGPFADDAAAATGGVGVGRMYRKTGGDMAWRVS